MLFDIGWPELMLIGVVALVVIGPKDLPRALRIAGYWVRKARTLSREFQNSVDQMIREAELDEMRQELKKATEFNVDDQFRKTIDPDGSLAESIKPPEIPAHFDEKPTAADPVLVEPESGSALPADAGPIPSEPNPARDGLAEQQLPPPVEPTPPSEGFAPAEPAPASEAQPPVSSPVTAPAKS